MIMASITLYDIFAYLVIGMIILAFAAAMSKFKDNVDHQVKEIVKCIKENQITKE